MAEHTADLLSCWIRKEELKARRNGEKLAQLTYGGPYGRRGMKEFLWEDQIPFRRSKEKCISTLYFWCKEQCIEDEIQIMDFLGIL